MHSQSVWMPGVWFMIALTPFAALAGGAEEPHPPSNQSFVDPHQSEPIFDFTLRLGQGGFTDDRSPIGKLGGGQMALDIKPHQYPVALSISGEYYTNSPDPNHPYEIADMTVVNLLYMTTIFASERAWFFAGGGMGRLAVPKGEAEPDEVVKGMVYNLEAGVRYRLFWRLGIYGIGKYLYASKTIDGAKVIDFNEGIVLIGLTLDFSL